jgi:ABC-type dipeptide/oligopeptide/nickel transport system permease component
MENSAIKMLERFGNVCYWAGIFLALLAFYFGFNAMVPPGEEPDLLVDFMTGFVYALPVWLSGLALRYIFTGRGLWKPN